MDYKESLSRFNKNIEKILAINYAVSIMQWDGATGAPKSSFPVRGESLGYFTLLEYDILINDEADRDINILLQNSHQLDDKQIKMVKKARKDFDKMSKIPSEEIKEYQILTNRAVHSWEEAREKNDFSIFSCDLKEIISYLRKFAKYRGVEGHPYNLYLDDYEEGMTIEKLNLFFETLRERIVPLLKKIKNSKKQIRRDFLNRDYPLETQRSAATELLEILHFDLKRGILKESTHPFTMGTNIDDVRLTSRYDKNNMVSGMLSVAHEGGHALYEQNISRDLMGTTLATGTSLGIHESQSRIYENNICKSKSFIDFYFPKLQKKYPDQLKDVSASEFYNAINIVEPSFIRVDADELTYSLHIMLRYEVEVALIEGVIEVDDLPEFWNKKMEEYFGIVPENSSMGVLQDVHWSHGLFGYFPTYALGSAYAAQFAKTMDSDIDLKEVIKNRDFKSPLLWLNKNVHQYGSLLTPDEISKKSTGELLNPEYFCDYLEKKYKAIYEIN